MKLTVKTIKDLSYPAEKEGTGAQHIVWDDANPGFGVRIYPSGKKSFVITYRVRDGINKGKKRIEALGAFGRLTLEQAQEMAQLRFADVIRGDDPLDRRRREQKGSTIADLSDEFKKYSKLHKKSWKLDYQRLDDYVLPKLGTRRIDSVSRRDVSNLHDELGSKYPYLANRVVELMSKMFEVGRDKGYIDEGAPNPARGVKPFKEEKRDRWVTPEEMPKLAKAINEEKNFFASKGLWLFLLTGLRKNELLKAKWEDVDWERKELRVPENKSGRVHYIPLSNEAIELLTNLPRVEGNPYVLPGEVEGKHLVNIDKPWRRVRAAAQVEDVRIHDLRRTVGSWLAQAGNSLHLIGRVLNHSSQATTAIYARFAQDHVAQAMSQHGKKLMDAVNSQPKGVVVPLEKVGQ